jgi:DHA1 family bicyclomycin/chloramphenicol resistance-like MFS transporter
MAHGLLRTTVVLGLLTALGLFAVDMYLPALPAIRHDLGTGSNAVQATLTALLVTIGVGQLIAGPLSDILGRKRPLYFGLVVFIVGSIGCSVAPTIGVLIAFRVVQGLGACAVMVTPRAVIRDLYTGPEAARLMSLLTVVYSISPILAPLAGSLVTDVTGWRSVFVVTGLLAGLCVVLVHLMLPETRLPDQRLQSSLEGALSGYRVLFGDRHFIALALIASLTFAGWFIYAANSSFVIINHFGMSPRIYALLFALNSVSFVFASQFNAPLAQRFGLKQVVRTAIIGHLMTMTLTLFVTLAGIDRLDVLVVLLFIGFGLNGVIVPSTFVLAMAGNPAFAGTASALIGTLNFAGGALAVAMVAPFADASPLPMVAGIAASSSVVFAIAMATLRQGSVLPLRLGTNPADSA